MKAILLLVGLCAFKTSANPEGINYEEAPIASNPVVALKTNNPGEAMKRNYFDEEYRRPSLPEEKSAIPFVGLMTNNQLEPQRISNPNEELSRASQLKERRGVSPMEELIRDYKLEALRDRNNDADLRRFNNEEDIRRNNPQELKGPEEEVRRFNLEEELRRFSTEEYLRRSNPQGDLSKSNSEKDLKRSNLEEELGRINIDEELRMINSEDMRIRNLEEDLMRHNMEDERRRAVIDKGVDFNPLTPTEIEVRVAIDYPENCPRVCPVNTVTVGDECFRYIARGADWKTASKDCEDQKGYLAIPELTYSQFAIDLGKIHRDIMGKQRIWIGANDQESYVVWKWVNGVELNQTDPSWYPGHPGPYAFNSCAQIFTIKRGPLQMTKDRCTTARSFLCEFDKL